MKMEKIKLIYKTDDKGYYHGIININGKTINSFGHTLQDCVENMHIAVSAFEELTDVEFETEEQKQDTVTAINILLKYLPEGEINPALVIAMQEYAKVKCMEQKQLVEQLFDASYVNIKNVPEPHFT